MGYRPDLSRRIAATLLLPLLLLLTAPPLQSTDFEAPDYPQAPFSGDGIFLEDSDRRRLLDALAALASGFRDLARVDGALRAKSIALALALDPMDYTVRAAFRSLAEGETPPGIAGFDSLSAVSESLWIASEKLATPPAEPEGAALAPFLKELALLVHPDPPRERLAAYGRMADDDLPTAWEEFVSLPPDSASVQRASELASQGKLAASGALPPAAEVEPDPFAPAAQTDPAAMEARGVRRERRREAQAEAAGEGEALIFEEAVSLSLPVVLQVSAVESAAVLGEFSLTIREPESFADVGAFPFLETSPASEYPFLPILARDEGVPLGQLEIPGGYPASRGWSWPDAWIADASFQTETSLQSPRRLTRAQGLLPIAVLLEAAFTRREPNPAFLLAGEIAALPNGRLRLGGEAPAVIEAASASGRRYLILPGGRMESIVEYLQRSGNLESVLRPEWIAADELEDVFQLALEETPPALLQASEIFAEIEAVAARLALADLAVNPRVQEKLMEIVDIFPNHLSARVLLEYGATPIAPEIGFAEKLSEIEALLEIFAPLRNADAPVGGVRNELEEVKTALFQMRPGIPIELRDYFSRAEAVHEAATRLLSLSSTTSSSAAQRRRELAEAFDQLDEARQALRP